MQPAGIAEVARVRGQLSACVERSLSDAEAEPPYAARFGQQIVDRTGDSGPESRDVGCASDCVDLARAVSR